MQKPNSIFTDLRQQLINRMSIPNFLGILDTKYIDKINSFVLWNSTNEPFTSTVTIVRAIAYSPKLLDGSCSNCLDFISCLNELQTRT